MTLEVCCANIDSVRSAVIGGADRVELCRCLDLDGLTPDSTMIAEAIAICHAAQVKVHVLIRPREGNFCYSPDELEEMLAEIRMAVKLGADGVVVGALDKVGNIDAGNTRKMIAEARRCSADRCISVTFHRAFDVCREPLSALEQLIAMGCDRVLTSGQQPTAVEGIPLLRQLVERAGSRISILCGARVNEDNAQRIIRETGAMEIHGSLRIGQVTNADKVITVKHAIESC